MVFQEDVRAVHEHTERLQRLAQALHDQGTSWRFYPVVEAFHALQGVPCTVAVTPGAERGNLTRCDHPRALRKFLGLIPSEYSTGARRRQGSITTAGNTHARRAGVEGAWAYRSPAKVSRHLSLRLEKQPKRIQDIRWKAQVRLCKRYRRLIARGKHANVVTVAMARELAGFLWAIAHQVPVTPSGEDRSRLNDDLRRFANVHRSMVYGYLGTEGETWTQNDAGTYALMRKAPQVGGGVLSQGKPTICVWGVLSSAALAPAGA